SERDYDVARITLQDQQAAGHEELAALQSQRSGLHARESDVRRLEDLKRAIHSFPRHVATMSPEERTEAKELLTLSVSKVLINADNKVMVKLFGGPSPDIQSVVPLSRSNALDSTHALWITTPS